MGIICFYSTFSSYRIFSRTSFHVTSTAEGKKPYIVISMPFAIHVLYLYRYEFLIFIMKFLLCIWKFYLDLDFIDSQINWFKFDVLDFSPLFWYLIIISCNCWTIHTTASCILFSPYFTIFTQDIWMKNLWYDIPMWHFLLFF